MNALAELPELALGAPEAAQAEDRGLGAGRIRALERTAIDEMLAGSGDRGGAAPGAGISAFFLNSIGTTSRLLNSPEYRHYAMFSHGRSPPLRIRNR
jgi:hypothetical protein